MVFVTIPDLIAALQTGRGSISGIVAAAKTDRDARRDERDALIVERDALQ